jgi:CRISPR-associated protein (TIGR02710 family)
VEALAEALAAWDLFNHKEAKNKLDNVKKGLNNLIGAVGEQKARRFICNVDRILAHCKRIPDDTAPSGKRVNRALILDLIANAKRRFDERRWDDATARYYRAIEAIAQLHLAERGITTSAVKLAQIPEPLRAELEPSAESGEVKLGLQQSWRLLRDLGDSNGDAFFQQFPDPRRSALSARNKSILAHGYEAVSEKTAAELDEAARALLMATEDEVPFFTWE